MKKILFLLLFTIASYGQAVFDEGIQITGNANSATATKVNVQEANGKVNTQTIKTGFNKNIGLGGSDVVGANTLLNQYSTTPVDWIATNYASGQVVFYGGKQWIAKIATVAGEVPAVSSKWDEITFEALSNKTFIVDAIPTDGSNNAVSSNGVFDALATKAPISSVHNPVTIGTANGLSLSTQQLSLGLASSGVTGALSGTDWNTFNTKFNTPTGLTTNYLPKWNGSGFGNSLVSDDGTTVNIGGYSKYTKVAGGSIITGAENISNNSTFSIKTANPVKTINFGYFNEDIGVIQAITSANNTPWNISLNPFGGRVLINKTNDDLTNQLQVAGTISASPATTANQVPTWGQVQAAARPYKVYTALLSQTGTNAPTATVLENTLGGTVVWSRLSTGTYVGTLAGAFAVNKTICFHQRSSDLASSSAFDYSMSSAQASTNTVDLKSTLAGGLADGLIIRSSVEIRVYN